MQGTVFILQQTQAQPPYSRLFTPPRHLLLLRTSHHPLHAHPLMALEHIHITLRPLAPIPPTACLGTCAHPHPSKSQLQHLKPKTLARILTAPPRALRPHSAPYKLPLTPSHYARSRQATYPLGPSAQVSSAPTVRWRYVTGSQGLRWRAGAWSWCVMHAG
jgi:hypothetical protein